MYIYRYRYSTRLYTLHGVGVGLVCSRRGATLKRE